MITITQGLFLVILAYCLSISIHAWVVLARLKNTYRMLSAKDGEPVLLRPGMYEDFVRTVNLYYLPTNFGREALKWVGISLAVTYCWVEALITDSPDVTSITLSSVVVAIMVFQLYIKLRLFSTYLIENHFVDRVKPSKDLQ